MFFFSAISVYISDEDEEPGNIPPRFIFTSLKEVANKLTTCKFQVSFGFVMSIVVIAVNE